MKSVSKRTKTELVAALRDRYQQASRHEKGLILDEFTSISGFHRKHAIRVLSWEGTEPSDGPTCVGNCIYGEAVREALIVIWEAADRICAKRLKPVLGDFVQALEKHGQLNLDSEVRAKVLAASPATIDRVLRPIRKSASGRRKKRSTNRVSKAVEIKTFRDWKDTKAGYLEIDFVVHGGGSMSGQFLHSLVATDVCSGWTEAVPLLAREQSLVVEGLRMIRSQFPVPMLGIDSDNDGAFINDTLAGFCECEKIVLTRSRVYQKNDQAWIEQKNGAVIRKYVGHDRFSGIVTGQVMAQLFAAVRLYVNFFQPSFKLRERVREGSKMKKKYYPPATPCNRLLVNPEVTEATKQTLQQQRESLDPIQLLHRIRQCQSALAALSESKPENTVETKELEQFLATLPGLWKQGEVRPTHRTKPATPRYWRTREDPFKEIWPVVLRWLQQDPDATATSLLERLDERYPDRFKSGHLRTLQRRVQEWRSMMAKHLVFGAVEGATPVKAVVPSDPAKAI